MDLNSSYIKKGENILFIFIQSKFICQPIIVHIFINCHFLFSRSTEERAQDAEDRATTAETELKLTQEMIRTLEKRLLEYSSPSDTETDKEKKSVTIVTLPTEPSKTPASENSTKSKPDKGNAKDKSSRASSRTSNKSKKK